MKTRREAALERRRKKKELINTETINREDNSKTKKGKAFLLDRKKEQDEKI